MARSRPASAVPLRDQARCEQCSEVVDVRAPGSAQHVEGYAVNRAQGGANMVTLMERHAGRWLCRVCVDLRKRGHKWQQLDLFDVDES